MALDAPLTANVDVDVVGDVAVHMGEIAESA